MKIIQKNKLTFLGIALGIITGYLYYYFVGCHSGSCAITSSPVNSVIYGAVLGGLLFNTLQDYLEKKGANNTKSIKPDQIETKPEDHSSFNNN